MAAPGKKPPSKAGKGAPPKPTDSTSVVGNNTSKPATGDKVPFNTRVDPEFKRRLKMFSVGHDIDMTDIMVEAVTEWLDRKGG